MHSAVDLKDRLADRIEDLAEALLGSANKGLSNRRELRFGNKGALRVWISGAKKGGWADFSGSDKGDLLGLIQHVNGGSFVEAMGWARAWLGDAPAPEVRPAPTHRVAPPEAGHDDRRVWSRDLARRLWTEGSPAAGTPAETYLASRGLLLPGDAPLRFHPAAWRNKDNGPHGPALLALMTSPEMNEPVGLHVTYLAPDGRGKAAGSGTKVMLGAAGVIRLVPDAEVTTGLGLAEGIETALATMQRTGWRPIWAATSAGAIAKFPLLAGIEALTLFADADTAGLGAARACAARWHEAGREARIIRPPAGDWDDATRGRAA